MTATTKVHNLDTDSPAEPIRAGLRRRLLALNYHAFARCLCLLLTRLGYEDVRLAGRTGWKGRNREGGYDIEATLPAGVGQRRVVVQAKQYDGLPLFQRSVDELRGACVRSGADEALLITTSTFSPVVDRVSARSQVAPVRLVDGEEMLGLMLAHRVGVWEQPGESPDLPHILGIDDAFFEELSRDLAGGAQQPKPSRTPPDPASPPRRAGWLVTVQVGSPGLFGGTSRAGRGRR